MGNIVVPGHSVSVPIGKADGPPLCPILTAMTVIGQNMATIECGCLGPKCAIYDHEAGACSLLSTSRYLRKLLNEAPTRAPEQQ